MSILLPPTSPPTPPVEDPPYVPPPPGYTPTPPSSPLIERILTEARGVQIIKPIPTVRKAPRVTVKAPKGRGVQCLQWHQGKRGRIPTVNELTRYRAEFNPILKSPRGSREWQLQ